MEVRISFKDQVLARYANQMGALGEGKANLGLSRALVRTGKKARTRVIRALVPQTGLKRATIAKAVREVRGDVGSLSFVLRTQGGNVRLKYFKARETRAGVSAAPWNVRQVYAGTFMKAGWWRSGRVVKPNWNGQVFRRVGNKFEVVRSGLFIPEEMLKGQSAAAWQSVIDSEFERDVAHELGRLLPG